MGQVSFLKSKGKRVGAVKEAETPRSKEALEKELGELRLDRSGVGIPVEPETAKVRSRGAPKDQKTRKKVILEVGNVAGVTAVEVESDGPEPRFHILEAGESLWKIAEATLGNGSRYMEIFEVNKAMLSDPDKIYKGQVLRSAAT